MKKNLGFGEKKKLWLRNRLAKSWFSFPIPKATPYTILAHCAEPLNLDSLALFYCHTLLDFSAEIQGFLRHFTALQRIYYSRRAGSKGAERGHPRFCWNRKERQKETIYRYWLPQIFGPSAVHVQSGLLQSVHLKLVDKIVLVLKARKNYYVCTTNCTTTQLPNIA